MQNKIPPSAAPSQSANDNGPLSSGQVKALKAAIAIMSFLIVAALVAIVGRVIYLAAVKKRNPAPVVTTVTGPVTAEQSLALPTGAVIKTMSMHGNRLLVHYQTDAGPGAAIVDLATGKTISRIKITIDK